MFSLCASATIPHPPAAVFAALASIEAVARWQVGVLAVRRARPGGAAHGPPTDGVPAGRLTLDYLALGVRHQLRARVTDHTPPARFAYRAEHGAFALEVALEVGAALGGAAVTYRLQLTTPPAGVGDAGGAAAEQVAAEQVAAFRRQLARRAPRDLARLERFLARRLSPPRPVPLAAPGVGPQTAACDAAHGPPLPA